MDTFYCVGCRFEYPIEKAVTITAGAHRDGGPVGFCFICAREIVPSGGDEAAGGDAAVRPEDGVSA